MRPAEGEGEGLDTVHREEGGERGGMEIERRE